MPSQACSPCRLSTLPNRFVPPRSRLPSWPVRVIHTHSSCLTSLLFLVQNLTYRHLNHTNLHHRLQIVTLARRHQDMVGMLISIGEPWVRRRRRTVEDRTVVDHLVETSMKCCVSRFVSMRLFLEENTHHAQCGEKGHYANHCRNRNVPGNRGGLDRAKRFGMED